MMNQSNGKLPARNLFLTIAQPPSTRRLTKYQRVNLENELEVFLDKNCPQRLHNTDVLRAFDRHVKQRKQKEKPAL